MLELMESFSAKCQQRLHNMFTQYRLPFIYLNNRCYTCIWPQLSEVEVNKFERGKGSSVDCETPLSTGATDMMLTMTGLPLSSPQHYSLIFQTQDLSLSFPAGKECFTEPQFEINTTSNYSMWNLPW